MTGTTARRTVVSIAVSAALACSTACTGSGGPDDPGGATGATGSTAPSASAPPSPRPPALTGPSADALRAVERATGRAGSARVESTTVMGRELSLAAAGALGWDDGLTGTLTITYTGGTTAETMRSLGTTAMEARYLPDAYYARMGDEFAERLDGRHWIKYVYEDLEDLGGDAGAGFADQMRNTTPHQAVKLLLTAGDVRRVGEETTRGRRTTHWSGTVGGATEQTVDIWVDDRDLLVKKVERGRTKTGELTQTAYYSDYGVTVSAERPPAADTADFKELLASEEN
ncbi:Lipoprotein OS=Streptomyces tendae OX=1932 GN=GUR47_17435 PE=4 SV=1 [Streptomyces tendae]